MGLAGKSRGPAMDKMFDWLGENPVAGFCVGLAFIAFYVWLYRANWRLAVALLFGLVIILGYFETDWEYWDRYFKVNWSMDRYQ